MSVLSEKVIGYLSLPEKMNILSTSNKNGETNIAIFGSLFMVDKKTIMLMLGDNHTFANLKENPLASLLVIAPGKTGMQTEGCRIYLKLQRIEDSGNMYDKVEAGVRAKVGDAAEMLKHLVAFDILKTRPIVDMGQNI
jgi:hypothetical protein